MKKRLLSMALAAAMALALQVPAAMPVHAKARTHVKTIYFSSQHDITNDGKKDRVKVQTKRSGNGVYSFKVYVNGKKTTGALNYNVNYGKCKAKIISVGGKSFLTTRFDATLSGDSGRMYQYKKGKFVTVIDPWNVLNVSDDGFFPDRRTCRSGPGRDSRMRLKHPNGCFLRCIHLQGPIRIEKRESETDAWSIQGLWKCDRQFLHE
jgi:hypothetical protein